MSWTFNKRTQHGIDYILGCESGRYPIDVSRCKKICAEIEDMGFLSSYTVRKHKVTLKWWKRKHTISACRLQLPKRKPVPVPQSEVALIKSKLPHPTKFTPNTSPIIIDEEKRRLIHDTVVQQGRGVGMHSKKPEIPKKLYTGFEVDKMHKKMMEDARIKRHDQRAIVPTEYIYWADIPIPVKSLKDVAEQALRLHNPLHVVNGRHICLISN